MSGEIKIKEELNELNKVQLEEVVKLKEGLDIYSSKDIVSFGVSAQRKSSDFVDAILSSTKTKSIDDAGKTLTSLMDQLSGFNTDIEGGNFITRLFSSTKKRISNLQRSYNSITVNVDKIVEELEGHRTALFQDVAMLDKLYDKNLDYIAELMNYIVAGEEKVVEVNESLIPELTAKAEVSGEQLDAQKLKDTIDAVNRLEKKVHDLKLTRTVAMQMLPQIRLQQSSNNVLMDKIQSSIVNSIPLWKSQMVIALGLAKTKSAIDAQKAVTGTTNELLRKNSEMLKTTTVEAAKASEEAIVDVEVLKKANANILESITEVINIQEKGREKRKETERELIKLEQELKDGLMQAIGR